MTEELQMQANPIVVGDKGFRTAQPPMSTDSIPLAKQARWMMNYVGRRQLFSFSGSGPIPRDAVLYGNKYPQINPDYDYEGNPYFAIITRSEPVSEGYHQLGGVIVPWRYQAGASLTWTQSGGAPETMWTSSADSHNEADFDRVTYKSDHCAPIMLYYKMEDPGTAGFAYHKLGYSKMCVAGLGVWTMPDRFLTGEYRLFDRSEFDASKRLAGKETNGKLGIGELIGEIGSIKWRASRCLLQFGHPTGIFTSRSSSWAQVPPEGAPLPVVPMAPFRGDTVSCSAAIVAGAVGASSGNPGYVNIGNSSVGHGFTIESDTEQLYSQYSAFSIASSGDNIFIEMKAPTNGCVYFRTVSLWEDL